MEFIKSASDTAILQNLVTGNSFEDTVKWIYQEHFDSLSWFIKNNGGNSQDAEDIFQEVVVSFIDLVKKSRFRGESSIRTFLFSMNRNLWLNELKRKGRALKRELKYQTNNDYTASDIQVGIVHKEEKEVLIGLVEQLGESCKKILVLFYYGELSMKEILERTDYESEQVVRNKKYKCLKKLEAMINEKPAIKQTLKTLLHG